MSIEKFGKLEEKFLVPPKVGRADLLSIEKFGKLGEKFLVPPKVGGLGGRLRPVETFWQNVSMTRF
ncbi:MAG TPA: hypothetical protein DDZ80_15630 [Cyanobacteria bacterium UBA8803]|nr:hypothetical protein [Cyanobacteria bacterium UBA9273]HBL59847.1 hypothetical protein [Cyanobacteria bacterium UBA8803]